MENGIPFCEADKTMLKQRTLSYLPRNLGEIEAHQQILTAIARVVPEVSLCIDKAEITIWPKVRSQELPINRAIAQCAYEANGAIGAAALDMSNLRALPEEALMEAWIALDYYSYVLKADYSVNIRNLQDLVSDVLLHPQPADPLPPPENIPISVGPIEVAIPPTTPIAPVKPIDSFTSTEPIVPTPVPQPRPPVTQKQKKKAKSGKVIAIVAAVAVAVVALALCAVLLITSLFSDVRKTEDAIDQIGTVTLDSEEKIQHAEQLFNELDADQQNEVANSDALVAARAEYDALVTDDAIEQIGTVTMSSGKAIEQAEALYDALSRDARNLVRNYKTLTAARKEYTRLETAIQDASDAIDAIGTVTLESEADIKAARSAYEALKKDNLQNYLSHKVTILNAAEAEYERLYYQDAYDTGMAHFDGKEYQDAISCFDNVIANCSNSTLVQNARDAKANAQMELARQSYNKKDYYTATLTLREVDAQYRTQEDYQKLNDQVIAALKKNRAGNGSVVGGKVPWGYCYFKVTAGDQDVCFKFQDVSNPDNYKLVYVRAGQSTKVNVQDGTYSIKWATGEYWFGKDHMFGPDTVYKNKGNVVFTTTKDGRYIYYRYLNVDLSDSSTTASIIDANSF